MKGTLFHELLKTVLLDLEVLHADTVIRRQCACSNSDLGDAPCERQKHALQLRAFLEDVESSANPRASADFPSTRAERTYNLGVEVYGPEILHRNPCVILSVPSGQLVVADPYEYLIEAFQGIARKVEERRDS